MAETKNLERLKATRGGHRGVATRLTREVDELVNDSTTIDKSRCETIQELLETKLKVLNALDEEILPLIEIEEIEREIEETSEVTSRIITAKKKLGLFTTYAKSKPSELNTTIDADTASSVNETEKDANTTKPTDTTNTIPNATIPTIGNSTIQPPGTPSTPNANHSNDLNSPTIQHVKPRLPKITLTKFKGDITKWNTFWDSFESTIHDNAGISKIDKFNYLNSLLEGTASRAIQGLPITNDNYDHAIEILKERFGRPQQIISAHMDEILKIPNANGDRTAPLRFMYDKVSVHVRGLASLGVSADQYGSLLIPIIMSKLPTDIRLQIARKSSNEVWDIEELLTTIKIEIEAREISEGASISNVNTRIPTPQRPKPTASTLVAREQRTENSFRIQCAFCNGLHYSASCSNVTNIDARKDKLKESGRCYLCLRKGHQSRNCTSEKKCRQCQGVHHQSICTRKYNVQETKESTTNKESNNSITSTNANISSTTAANPCKGTVLLQTARAVARNGTLTTPVRILFDTGSQRSYVKGSVQSQLKLKPTDKETLHLNTFGDSKYKKQQCEVFNLTIENKNGTEGAELTAIKFPTICSPLNSKVNINYAHLEGLELADYDNCDNGDGIDILIGADQYWNFVTGDIVRGDDGPTAISSKLGWLLSGCLESSGDENKHTVTNLIIAGERFDNSITENDNDTLNSSLKRFWDVETIGIAPIDEENQGKPNFIQDISFNGDRYEVGLPWKEDRRDIETDYDLCHNRLRSLHSKLRKQPELLQEYDRNIQEQLASGIIEKVPIRKNIDSKDSTNEIIDDNNSYNNEVTEVSTRQRNEGFNDDSPNDIHYIPHHGVVRKDRSTTKLRVVYDGSATTTTRKYSLNDCLLTGPNYIPHLFDMMVKFRIHPVALVADIEKAFLMVGINERDRDMLRFLWFANAKEPDPDIVELRFCRLVFGLRPSPAILGATIDHHLETHKDQNAEVVNCLKNSLYVDDFVSGAENEETAFQIYKDAKGIMSAGGFNLRKWNSNSQNLVQSINSSESTCTTKQDNEKITNPAVTEEDLSYAKTTVAQETSVMEDKQVKILGIIWNFETDEFLFNLTEVIKYARSLPFTKRSLLRWSSKIFDPLGFLTPFTIRLKNLFQEICVNKVDWDDELQEDTRKRWNNLISELDSLNGIRVPRCYFTNRKKPKNIQIHGFSDASERAYAAVVYLRVVYEDDTVEVKLIASKARVTPSTKQSIPRLELLGAAILARLVDTITNTLPFEAEKFYWVDSMVVLHWIKNERSWKQYIQNRVNEIRRLTTATSWRFCPGLNNPADNPSRGMSGNDLVASNTWWSGPEFLCQGEEAWPINSNTSQTDNDTILREVTKQPRNCVHSLATSNETNNATLNLDEIIDISRYGYLNKLLRIIAYVLRFVNIVKGQQRSHQRRRSPRKPNHVNISLTASEIHQAETIWIKSIQGSSFSKEIDFLSTRNSGSSAPLYVSQFGLFLDEQCILKCKGRLNNASLDLGSKNPILLPSRHRFVELLIEDAHNRVKHNGIRDTLTTIRERYWILRGREATKRIIKKCVVCRKAEGAPYKSPPPPDLPTSRVSEDPPFSNVGIDFAGPLYVKTNQEKEDSNKVYILLFTCASTRAVHLELTQSLNVPSFLRAFRRFASRRGLPALIMSDNAKTFKSACKEIQQITRAPEVWQYLTDNRITWNFIVEKAPWWGGFWERMVRSVKRPIKKILGRSCLTYDELHTILVEVESLINSRPITYIYDDEESISYALTPSHLLYGRRITNMPNGVHNEIISSYNTLTRKAKYHYNLLQKISNHWKNDYLLSLREQSTVKKGKNPNIAEGDIVIVKNDSTTRNFWKLAKVEQLLTGADGVTRAVMIRVCSGGNGHTRLLRRSIKHVVPIEVKSST